LSVLIGVALSGGASAEMVPLKDLDLNGKTEEFIITRCAGFYVSVLATLPGTSVPESFKKITETKARALMIELVRRHQERFSTNLDDASASVRRDIVQVSLSYEEVFNISYIETGERFDNRLFYSDSKVCENLIAK
jgi:hypothetical protein